MPGRLTVGHSPLKASILVRVQARQPGTIRRLALPQGKRRRRVWGLREAQDCASLRRGCFCIKKHPRNPKITGALRKKGELLATSTDGNWIGKVEKTRTNSIKTSPEVLIIAVVSENRSFKERPSLIRTVISLQALERGNDAPVSA